MEKEKQIRRAARLQRLMGVYTKSESRKADKYSKARLIETSHGEVRVREYGFESDEVAPLLVNMHGGGFVLGGAELDDYMCRYLRKETNVKIISIDYPKAPTYPFPIGLNAGYEVVKHYIRNAESYKLDPRRVGVGGHSAGANFATVFCIMAKEKGDLFFNYQILDYPPLDMTIDPFKRVSPKGALPPKMIDMFNACYFNNDIETAKSPYLSPVFASEEQLAGLPPALIIVAGRDSLHDDGVRYHKRLEESGVAVELHDFKDSKHGFTLNQKPDALKAHAIMADFINRNKGEQHV